MMRAKLLALALPIVCSCLAAGLLVLLAGARPSTRAAAPAALHAGDDPAPPSSPVRLIFVHHSTGENWLADWDGGLGIALRDNDYYVSDTNYGWGPGGIGDLTDIPDWYRWFTGPQRDTYMAALYAESGQHSSYSRLATNPGGENQIVMFKSCFPNSHLGGSPTDPPAASADHNSSLTVANAKRIYLDLLDYFAAQQSRLFVVITAPPLVENDTDAAHAANARAFNDWLVDDWLAGYPHDNVAVFDFYNVLTSNGGDRHTNDLGSAAGNHHRWWNGAVQHVQSVGNDYARYGSDPWDSHPTAAGNQKATAEFVPLLNVFYHRWAAGPSKSGSTRTPAYGETVTYTILVRNLAAPLTATLTLSDQIPVGLAYLTGSLTATAGVVTDTAAPTLHWSGVLTPAPVVTITYAATVSAAAPQALANTASIAAPGCQAVTLTDTIIANARRVYLPLVMRQ